jgi:hypothetical protein
MAFGRAPISVEAAADVVDPRFVAAGDKELRLRAGSLYVGVDYASALGLRVVEGRWLESADAQPSGSPSAAVISASLSATLWPQQTAVGRHFRFGFDTPGTDHEVVGVVADFAYGSMRFDQPAVVLMAAPDSMLAMNTLSVAIRTEDPDALVEPLRRSLGAQISDAPPASITTARDLIAADLGRERLGAWLFSGFGLVALVLGVGGVFGLVAYLAESRKREFGVRIALGATPSDLRRLSLGSGLVPVAIGAALGLVGAVWVARAAESQLVGVGRLDPTSYLAATLLVLTSAAGAALVAARRVHRLSPMDALRSE